MHKNRLNIDSSNSPTLESLLVLKQKAMDIAATKRINYGNAIENTSLFEGFVSSTLITISNIPREPIQPNIKSQVSVCVQSNPFLAPV
jgi:hypothetical protein